MVVACHATAPVALPEAPTEARSGVLAITSDGRRAARAFELEAPPPPVAARAGADVVVMFFDRPLDALGLAAGPIELAEGDASRPFPAALGLFHGRLADGAVAFEPVDADHPDVAPLRRSGLPLDACFEREAGCYARPEDIAARVCTAPCPSAAPTPPDPPAAVTAPDFATCPEGWAAVDGRCEPPARVTCLAHEAQWVSASACSRVGSACPAPGAWSDALPSGAIVYVRAGAVGGDGTSAAPYGAIQEAIDMTSGARVIALAAGTYAENVALEDGVTLFGACVESTIVEAPNGVTIASNGAATIANLTVRGARIAIETLATTPGDRLVLRDLAIEQTSSSGIVRGIGPVEVDAERVVVRGAGEAAWLFGAGAKVTLTDVVVRVRGRDLWATGLGTEVTLSRVILSEAAGNGDPGGVDASEQGRVVGDAVALYGHVGPAIRARALGEIVLTDVFVADTRGDAVSATGAATIELTRASIEDTRGNAIDVQTGTVALTDASIRRLLDVTPAIDVVAGSHVSLSRVRVEGARGAGVAVFGVGTHLEARDLAVIDTQSRTGSPDGSGVGVSIYSGATFDLRGVRVSGALASGFQILGDTSPPPGPTTTGYVADLDVERIGPRWDLDAFGVYFRGRVDVRAERVRVRDIDNFAVLISGGAVARVEDVTVDDAFMGVRTDSLGDAELDRVAVTRTRGGALCIKGDSTAVARDVAIDGLVGTESTDDGSAFCAIGVPVAASGIVVNNLAALALERYTVAETPGIGMSLRGRAGVSAIDGAFSDAALAVQLAPELPLEEVLVRTTFAGTGVRLDVQ